MCDSCLFNLIARSPFCSDVAGWAPNAGPSHGYNTGDVPTRFTAGNVATENKVSNSRTDIGGPTAYYAATNTPPTGTGSGVSANDPPRYITNEFGDVVGTEPAVTGNTTDGATLDCTVTALLPQPAHTLVTNTTAVPTQAIHMVVTHLTLVLPQAWHQVV